MEKSEILKLISNFTAKDGYILIDVANDSLTLCQNKDDIKLNDYQIFFSGRNRTWSKNEISEIIKTFIITKITFADGKELSYEDIRDVFPIRMKSLDETLHSYLTPYTKRNIFLLKKTKKKAFLDILLAQFFIVPVRMISKSSMDPLIIKDAFGYQNYIPIFTDSEEYELFKNSDYYDTILNKDEYRPLILSISQIKTYFNQSLHISVKDYMSNYMKTEEPDSYVKDFNINLMINPTNIPIANKSFSIFLPAKLLNNPIS